MFTSRANSWAGLIPRGSARFVSRHARVRRNGGGLSSRVDGWGEGTLGVGVTPKLGRHALLQFTHERDEWNIMGPLVRILRHGRWQAVFLQDFGQPPYPGVPRLAWPEVVACGFLV